MCWELDNFSEGASTKFTNQDIYISLLLIIMQVLSLCFASCTELAIHYALPSLDFISAFEFIDWINSHPGDVITLCALPVLHCLMILITVYAI